MFRNSTYLKSSLSVSTPRYFWRDTTRKMEESTSPFLAKSWISHWSDALLFWPALLSVTCGDGHNQSSCVFYCLKDTRAYCNVFCFSIGLRICSSFGHNDALGLLDLFYVIRLLGALQRVGNITGTGASLESVWERVRGAMESSTVPTPATKQTTTVDNTVRPAALGLYYAANIIHRNTAYLTHEIHTWN